MRGCPLSRDGGLRMGSRKAIDASSTVALGGQSVQHIQGLMTQRSHKVQPHVVATMLSGRGWKLNGRF